MAVFSGLPFREKCVKEKQRLLFIVNGLGLGNSTRCEAIIEQLSSNKFEIDVMTSGNGLRYFAQKPYLRNLRELSPLQYGQGRHGQLSVLSTLRAWPQLLKSLRVNVRHIESLIQTERYSAIIIDSDYTAGFLIWRLKIPVIALNNANVILQECRQNVTLPAAVLPQYFIETLDFLFHCTIPDLVLSPSLEKRQSRKNIKQLAPFIRRDLKRTSLFRTQPKKILVMLSGSVFGTSTGFLKNLKLSNEISVDVIGRDGVSTERIRYHGKVYDNKSFIREADILVINAGFSAVSEAVVLSKPCIVIPIANHAEQLVNARRVQDLGLGLIAAPANVTDKLDELIERYPEFIQKHVQFDCASSGSYDAAVEIEKVLLRSKGQQEWRNEYHL